MPADSSFRLELPCTEEAGRTARSVLRSRGGFDSANVDLPLILTELVNNAVVHSGCAPEEAIEIVITRDEDRFHISVRDPGRAHDTAHVRGTQASVVGGMGLWLIDRLARRWGAERVNGYRVWAEVPISPVRRRETHLS